MYVTSFIIRDSLSCWVHVLSEGSFLLTDNSLRTACGSDLLVVHGWGVMLGRLLMVRWMRVGLGCVFVGEWVHAHVALVPCPLGVPHGGGGEVRGWHHDWRLHGLLPHLAAAALLWKKTKQNVHCVTNKVGIKISLRTAKNKRFCWSVTGGFIIAWIKSKWNKNYILKCFGGATGVNGQGVKCQMRVKRQKIQYFLCQDNRYSAEHSWL